MNQDNETVQNATLLADSFEPREIGITEQSYKSNKSGSSTLTVLQRTILESLLLVCVLGMVPVLMVKPSSGIDEDLWWHLRTGDWIIQHYSVPTHDSFSSYTMGKKYVAYSWAFEVLVTEIYRHWGLHGILTLTTLSLLACTVAVIGLLSRYTSLLRAMALGTLVLTAIIQLAAPRPWLFTILFFTIELYLLLQARERGRAAWLWPVAPLFALWASIHIQFVYGLGLIGLFALEGPLASLMKWPTPSARLRARYFWGLLAASSVSTLANPYGWQLYSVVLQYATQSVPLHIVEEMQALDFRSIADWAALLLVCSAFFAQGSSRRRNPLMFALLVVSCWFGFRSTRDVWFLAIASALALADHMRSPNDATHAPKWRQWAIALPIGVAFAFAALSSGNVSEARLREAEGKRFPEKAAAFVESHALRGSLYNSYGWGGYLIWRLPNLPVSIDGRANLHGDEHLTRWADTYVGKRDWAEDPELAKANTILLERDTALASILRSDRRYLLVYEDDITSVFQPVRGRTGPY